MKSRFTFLILLSVIAAQGVAFRSAGRQGPVPSAQGTNPDGRWQVKFTLSGVGEKNLIIDAQAKGFGSFLLLDTASDGKSVVGPLPAAWSQTTNDRVNFSGEVELPIGTCCREVGTLILKGKFVSNSSISGKAVFIGSTIDEENLNGYRSMLGAFTATRIVGKD